MSELINQWALSLKRAQENQGMAVVLSSPEFYQSLLATLEKALSGKMKWHNREEVLMHETYSDDFVKSLKKFASIKKKNPLPTKRCGFLISVPMTRSIKD